MKEELSEHTFQANDKDALAHLKVLMEFTTPTSLRKSLQTCFFTFLNEEAEKGQNERFKEIAQDYHFLFEFLDKLENE